MSDDEDASGFGAASESEDEGGFGGADESDDEEGGFGDIGDDFGEAEESDDDGGGFGDADESDDDGADAAPAPKKAAAKKAAPKKAAAKKDKGTGKGKKGGQAKKDKKKGMKFEKAKAEKKKKVTRDVTNDFVAYAKANLEGTHNYQLEKIEKPVSKAVGAKAAVAKVAVNQVFVRICQWMGITAVVGKDDSIGTLDFAAEIIKPGIYDPEMRDEIYLQLMKQMTDNPAKLSRAKGVILLALVCGCFNPSDALLPIVKTFIDDGPPGFRAYLLNLITRTGANGARTEPPCMLEFLAAKRKQIMRVGVTTDLMLSQEALHSFVTTTTGTDFGPMGYIPSARLDPASTNREWVEQIARQEGITDSFGFSIYLDRFGTLTSLHGSGGQGNHIMDAISKIDAKSRKVDPTKKFVNIEKQLSFRKEFFAKDHDSMKDPVATAKIFHQIQAGIKSGLYKPKSDAKYNEMCAQFYYVDNGDDMEQSYLEAGLKNWLPAAAQSDKRIAEVEKIHAKADFTRKSWNATQVQGLLISFAIEEWGQVNSFSSDGAIQLIASKK